MDPRLVTVIAEEVPNVIALIKSAFAKANPDVPVPSSAEIVAMFDADFFASLAIDDQILSDG